MLFETVFVMSYVLPVEVILGDAPTANCHTTTASELREKIGLLRLLDIRKPLYLL